MRVPRDPVQDFPLALLFDRDGNLWVGQYGAGLSVFRNHPRHLGWKVGETWLLLWDGRFRAYGKDGRLKWENVLWDPAVARTVKRLFLKGYQEVFLWLRKQRRGPGTDEWRASALEDGDELEMSDKPDKLLRGGQLKALPLVTLPEEVKAQMLDEPPTRPHVLDPDLP